MKLGVGLLAVSVTLLAFSCGKSGSGESHGGGSGGTGAGGTAAGAGGSSASGGSGQASGAGGSTAGTTAQSGAGGSNSSGAGGTGAQAGTATGAGGTTDPGGGQAGSGEAAGASGAGNPTGSLTLFVMFDRSWSMNECGDGTMAPVTNNSLDCPTVTRWDLTSSALVQFFQDPAALNLNVALRFFPDDEPGCTGFPTAGVGFPALDAGTEEDAGPPDLNCDVNVCSEPLVPAAPLSAEPAPVDAHEAALIAAVTASVPAGPEMPNPNPQTPTSAALGGAEKWAVAYRQAHPDEPTAVVLITDGEAQGCDTNNANIARMAADAHDTAGVLTYVIGLTGSSESGLNQIANAGGTESALFVIDGSTVVQDLFAALSTIRKRGH